MTAAEFLKCLKKSQLLTDKQQQAIRRGIESTGKSAKPEAIAKRLVREGLITQWHARMLLTSQTGFTLDRYRLLEPIGKGGMGRVFKARDLKRERIVAIKVMAKKLARNPKLVKRFRREIEVASQLNSPHIVRTIDAGHVGDSHFMVMEYVEGEGLDEIAERVSRLQPGHACELIRQAALGLQSAHELGMVHRDIKPANLILGWDKENDPQVRILDMGLARIENDENEGMTRTGQVMGTPDFMAPEQGWNTAAVDIRADIYSLGLTLFRLLTGTIPFAGDNPLQVLMARCSADAPAVQTLLADIDPGISDVVQKMTARDPAKRYQEPQGVATALLPFCEIPDASSLAGAPRETDAPAATVIQATGSTHAQNEPSFQEFLRDMDSGAQVSLFEDAGPSTGTTIVATEDRQSGSQRSARWPMIAGLSGLVVALATAGFVMSQGDDPPPDKTKQTVQAPVQVFRKVSPQYVDAGQAVSFYIAPENADTSVTYELADAPAGMTLAPSGEVYWVPERTHASATVTARVLAKRNDTVEELKVPIHVRAAALNAKIVRFENVVIEPGKPWTQQLRTFGTDLDPSDVRFRLAGELPQGLRLHTNDWTLSWTPPQGLEGRYQFNIELIDPRDNTVVDTAVCSVMVRPPASTPVLRSVTLPVRTIEAGKELVADLRANLPEPARMLRWSLGPSTPRGARVDPVTGRFVWRPPADLRGRREFQVFIRRRNMVIATAAFSVIVVEPVTTPPVVAEPNLPPDADVARAEANIRELFKRDFSQRSVKVKQDLSRRLLIRSFDQEDRAMRYALLKLARETADAGRGFDTAVAAIEELRRSYQTDSVTMAASALKDYRLRNQATSSRILVGEAALREGRRAVGQSRLKSAKTLLEVADLASRNQRSAQFGRIVKTVDRLLESLPTDSDEPKLDETQELARKELQELLRPYQFMTLFAQPGRVNFVSGNNLPLPNGGRDLWTIGNGTVALRPVAAVDAISGFVDRTHNVGPCVIRMDVAADSTTGMLLIGAPREGRFDGFQIPLTGEKAMFIEQSGQAKPLAVPKSRLVHHNSGWDFVEVRISGRRFSVFLNGTRVNEARLPRDAEGRIGILAVLRPTGKEHRFRARNVRVMEISED